MAKDLYGLGDVPPIGEVPAQMHAQLVRPDRYGEPEKAIQDEVIDVPELGPHDALVMVMAAGVNFNNVWAARGIPVDVTKTQARWDEPTDFHIVGSDASGRRLRGRRRGHERAGRRPRRRARGPMEPRRPVGGAPARTRGSPAASASGGTTPAGARSRSSARCRRTSACRRPTSSPGRRPRPRRSPAPPRTACSSAGRRTPSSPATWCSSGARAAGLGSLAVQLVANAGGRAVGGRQQRREGRVRDRARRGRLHQPQGLLALGRAAGLGQRRVEGLVRRREGVRQGDLGRARREGSPRIVFDHPGQDTIPTSIFVADRGGMVVICAGTSGYDTMVDVRYLWTHAEALSGLAPVQRRAGGSVQSARDRRQGPHDARATSTRTTRAGTCIS